MLAFLVAAAVHAQPIVAVGEPDNMGITCSCHWTRLFARGDGSVDLFVTGGGNYTHNTLVRQANGRWRTSGSARALTSIGELVDHAVARCPDGTWLHVASANRTELLDDSFYMMHYGLDLELLNQRLVVDGDTVLRYNDAPILCDANTVATVGHPRDYDSHDGVLLWFASDGTVSRESYLDTIPPVGGSSLIWDARREEYLSFRALGPESNLFVVFLDRDFQQTAPWKEIALDPRPPYLSWPQTVIPFGDGYAVAHLVRREGVAYSTDSGDIQVTILDADLDLLQSVQVTEIADGGGAHRPSLTRVGDELLVGYEESIQPRLVVLQLDPDFPPEPDPITGEPGWLASLVTDTGTPADTATELDSGGGGGTPDQPEPDAAPAREPVADAGPDRVVTMGAPVQLDGRRSSDPDSEVLTYAWTFDDPTLSLTSADQSVAIFEPPAPGVYRFRLLVHADGASASDEVVVTVQEAEGCGCTSAPSSPIGVLALLGLLGLCRRSMTPTSSEEP